MIGAKNVLIVGAVTNAMTVKTVIIADIAINVKNATTVFFAKNAMIVTNALIANRSKMEKALNLLKTEINVLFLSNKEKLAIITKK